MNYQLLFPQKIILGYEAINHLSEILKDFGKKTLLVIGRNSLARSGFLEKIKEMLTKNGISFEIYSGIQPEPYTTVVDDGMKILKEYKPNSVVGIGGGSVIDVAKALAGLANEPDFTTAIDYLEVDGTRKVTSEGLHFISIPTVFGTGSEVTMNSVLRNPFTKNKRSIRSENFLAKVVISDPNLALTLTKPVSISSGMDCLCHLIEGYISKKSNDFCIPFILEGLNILKQHLLPAMDGKKESVFYLAIASLYSGFSILNSGLTLAHGIGGVIGGRYDLPHGIACSLALPEVIENCFSSLDSKKQQRLNEIFGGNVIIYLREMISKLNIKFNLKPIREKEKIKKIINDIISASSSKSNPVEVNENNVFSILKKIGIVE